MKRKIIPPLSSDVAEKIVNLWKTSKLNTMPAIAKEFEVSEHQVSRAINEYLSKCLPQNH